MGNKQGKRTSKVKQSHIHHIRILSRSRLNYSNRRFKAEAKELGFKLSVVDPLEYEVVLGRHRPMLYRGGRVPASIDVIIPRLGANITNYGLAVIAQFEMMGVPVLNGSTSIIQTRNKLWCIQLMSRSDIDIPRTVFIRHPSELCAAVEMVGGFPVVLKLLSGTQGIGVMLAENLRAIESTLDTLWSLGQDILIQECVNESVGRDIRVVVVGDHAVAAMRRHARLGDFRSNVHRGGTTEGIAITDEIEQVAIQAAKIVGLEVAGVDLLESRDGPKVIEVNSSPGLEGIEGATGVNVARTILEHAAQVGANREMKRRR